MVSLCLWQGRRFSYIKTIFYMFASKLGISFPIRSDLQNCIIAWTSIDLRLNPRNNRFIWSLIRCISSKQVYSRNVHFYRENSAHQHKAFDTIGDPLIYLCAKTIRGGTGFIPFPSNWIYGNPTAIQIRLCDFLITSRHQIHTTPRTH